MSPGHNLFTTYPFRRAGECRIHARLTIRGFSKAADKIGLKRPNLHTGLYGDSASLLIQWKELIRRSGRRLRNWISEILSLSVSEIIGLRI